MLQIVVDAEGNLMLDSQGMRQNFNVSINLGDKGEALFMGLQCVKAHYLGKVFPATVNLITGDDGKIGVVHQSQAGIDVHFNFEDGPEVTYPELVSGTEIGTLTIT